MRMNEVTPGDRRIDAYGAGGFRVGETRHEGAVLILPDLCIAWEVGTEIDLASLASVIALAGEIDLLVIGVGAEVADIPPPTRAALDTAEIGVEIMTTGAACRTFNVLLSESRRVVAALLPV